MPTRRLRYRIAASAVAGALFLLPGGYVAAAELSALNTIDRAQIARSERFVAAEAFAVGARIGDHVVIAVGFNFETHFYPLVETDRIGAPLDIWTLGRSADDATLIAMIGGENKVAVSLSVVHRLIALGNRGDSHTDGQSNFAYVRSPRDRRLWAIHWTMSAAGEWIIGAVFVPHPDMDWQAGSRLFAPSIVDDKGRQQPCAVHAKLSCVVRP
jgi:hypothetical protein